MTETKRKTVDFVQKLVKIMETHPNTLHWSDDGLELVLENKEFFIDKVLPEVFRHRKYESLVRQLNMYGFRKVCRKKDSLHFRNLDFFKGNERNFHLIQRKKKESDSDQLEASNIMIEEEIDKEELTETPPLQSIFTEIARYKSQVVLEIDRIRKTIEGINREVSNKKSAEIKPMILNLKEAIIAIEANALKAEHILEPLKQSCKKDYANIFRAIQAPKDVSEAVISSKASVATTHCYTNPFISTIFRGETAQIRGQLGENFSIQSITNFLT